MHALLLLDLCLFMLNGAYVTSITYAVKYVLPWQLPCEVRYCHTPCNQTPPLKSTRVRLCIVHTCVPHPTRHHTYNTTESYSTSTGPGVQIARRLHAMNIYALTLEGH